MLIRLLSVMHKMHKALVFKDERLIRRFLCICTLIVAASILLFPAVKGYADGSLKLNTDILTNNESGVGGSGEFSIRALLFSKELDEQNQKIQNTQEQVIKNKKEIIFNEKSTQQLDRKVLIKKLFQNYQPQIIEHSGNYEQKEKNNFYLIGILVGPFLTLLGIIFGNKRAKSRQRRTNHV